MDDLFEWRLFCDEETLQSIHDAAEMLSTSEGDYRHYVDSILYMFNGCFRAELNSSSEEKHVDWKKDGF